MTDATTQTSNAAVDADAPLSVSALQCQLVAAFQESKPRRAIQQALGLIAGYAEAKYAVIHARMGTQMVSEEWSQVAVDGDDPLRHSVNTIMWDAMSAGLAKCVRLRQVDEEPVAVTAALLFDENLEVAGAVAIVVEDCEHERAMDILSWFEGLTGYLALLLARGDQSDAGTRAPALIRAKTSARQSDAATHPMRLAIGMVSDLKNQHDLEIAAIGFVTGGKVKVAAVSGMDEVRSSNPGVVKIREAMEECLDARGIVICSGSRAQGEAELDYRLHAQWSDTLAGLAVGSLPLLAGDKIVAIISVARQPEKGVQHEEMQEFADDLAEYSTLVPLSVAASRGVMAHAVDRVVETYRRITDGRRRKVLASAVVLFVLWLFFGTLPHSVAVPCVVKATANRSISCPREGILQDLFVKPGDVVRKGQLLAILDAHEDVLERDKLKAELATVEAQADKALAENEAGEWRILAAKQKSLEAQVEAIERAISQAKVRAPEAGVILSGDLREKLGGRVALGDPLFELARDDEMMVKLQIPERQVLDAREAVTATFAPAARPEENFALGKVWIEPSSTVLDGRNVFLGEASTDTKLGRLAPGMEGVAYLEVEGRSAWWVLTHRVTHWLKMRFWL